MQLLRTRPILALIAAILALLLLSGIAYAVARFAGFIPGIGFVNNVQSVLPTPVVVQREIPLTPTSVVQTPQTAQTTTTGTATVTKPEGNPASVSVQERG